MTGHERVPARRLCGNVRALMSASGESGVPDVLSKFTGRFGTTEMVVSVQWAIYIWHCPPPVFQPWVLSLISR